MAYTHSKDGGGFAQLDLSGKLIIKVQLGDDIRRIPIHNEDITYDELVLMMQRVFRSKFSTTDELTIKYKDEDNDLITIFDSSDLSFAIQCSRILKLTLFVNGAPRPLEGDDIKHIRSHLIQLRDKCNYLLDTLEPPIPDSGNGSMGGDNGMDNRAAPVDSTTPASALTKQTPIVIPKPPQNVAAAAGSKEFDPLSSQKSVDENQQKVMSSFGIAEGEQSTARPGTPDSIASDRSASTRTTPQQQPPSTTSRTEFIPHQNPWGGAADQLAQSGSSQASQQPPQPGYGQSSYSQAGAAGYTAASSAPSASGQPPASASSGQPSGQYGYPAAGAQPYAPPASSQPGAGAPPGQQYAQAQPGYPAPGQSYPGSGHPGQPPTSQPGYPGYPGGSPAHQPPPPQQGAPGGANPYSRGPSYGQYPRPQGQYPQAAYPQPGQQPSQHSLPPQS